MQRKDHSEAQGRGGARPDARGDGRTDARGQNADVRRMIGFVALISASFDGALRQLDPGLTLSQYAALDAINRAGRLRPFRLASQQRISRQLAWQTCKRLETLGLVAITDMEDGKRGVEVMATTAGEAHLDRVALLLTRLADRLAEPGPKGERFDTNPTRRGLRLLAHAAGALQDEGEATAAAEAKPGAPDRPACKHTAMDGITTADQGAMPPGAPTTGPAPGGEAQCPDPSADYRRKGVSP